MVKKSMCKSLRAMLRRTRREVSAGKTKWCKRVKTKAQQHACIREHDVVSGWLRDIDGDCVEGASYGSVLNDVANAYTDYGVLRNKWQG